MAGEPCYDSLVALEHEVIEFRYPLAETFRHLDPSRPEDAAFIAENRPRLGKELMTQIRSAHATGPIDLFFSYFYDACVDPAVLEEIRSLGIVAVNWYCNASYQLHLVQEIAPHYDWCLVPERFRLEDYRTLGARPLYCQEAANPRVYAPCPARLEFDVAFAGQCYADRPSVVRWLRGEGVDVRVWGPRWEHHIAPCSRNPLRRLFSKPSGLPARVVGGVLSDRALIELYSRARIHLGFAAVGEPAEGAEQIRLESDYAISKPR